MNDHDARVALHLAAREMERRFPGRTFAFFVFPAKPGQEAHYVSTAPRQRVLVAFAELAAAGMPGIPGNPGNN